MGDLSFHFSRSEFACPCCGELVIDMELIDQLERLRFLVGKPIIILSGYRCPKHNREVGGAPTSQHLYGRAADIRVEGMSSLELFLEALRCEFGGIGLYPNFVHVDVRREPFRALWGRSADGRYVPIAEAVKERLTL